MLYEQESYYFSALPQARTKADAMKEMLKRLAHRTLFPASEFLNTVCLKIARRFLSINMRRLEFNSMDRVLVIAPHPDDETLGCGGAIGMHLRAGCRVRILIVTDGRRSRAGGYTPDKMAQLRAVEAQNAMEVLRKQCTLNEGALELVQPLLQEGAWRDGDLDGLLARQVSQWKPTIVYTTSSVDFHPEHLRVAGVVAQVLSKLTDSNDKLSVRAYELQVPLTPTLANTYADIIDTETAKEEALHQYHSQSGSFLWVKRYARYLRALYGSKTPLEVFWEMTPQQYVRVHAKTNPQSNFRSLRLRPFTDLGAWVIGGSIRRALREKTTMEQGKGE